MKMSTEIKDLAKALSNAQAQLKSAEFDSTNPHFRNKYASISSIMHAIRPVLAPNGLAYSQVPSTLESGKAGLITIIMHTSGQWIQGELELLLNKQDMQALGAALTYAKRQALCGMFGVSADDDDDGNQAVAVPKPQYAPTPKVVHNYAPQVGVTAVPAGISIALEEPVDNVKTITAAQKDKLYAMTGAAGWTKPEAAEFLTKIYKVKSSMDLTQLQFNAIVKLLDKKPTYDQVRPL